MCGGFCVREEGIRALCWLIGGEVVLAEVFEDDSNELLASLCASVVGGILTLWTRIEDMTTPHLFRGCWVVTC